MFRLEDTGVAVETVRYGRARLTIARTAPASPFDDLDDLLDAYERGDARPTSVTAAFLRQRVVDHTPSFHWGTSKLTDLIPIVCAASDDPKLEASTPDELADALVRTRAGHPPARLSGNGAHPRRRFPFSLVSR